MGLFSNSLSIILIFRFLTPNISLIYPSLLSFSLSQFLNEYDRSRFSTIQSQFHFRSSQFIIFEIFSKPLNFAKLRYDCRVRTNVRDQTFRRNLTSNLFISRYKSRKKSSSKRSSKFFSKPSPINVETRRI